MAESGSAEGTNPCDICKVDDQTVEAIGFCTICDQYLCCLCKQYHRRVAVTKGHTILDVDELPNKPVGSDEQTSSDEVTSPKCSQHSDLCLEYFCENHEKAICKTCKLLDHRKCEKVQLLKTIASEKANDCAELLDLIEHTEKCFEKVSVAKESEKAVLIAEKKKVMKQIKQKRKEFEDREQAAIREVEKIFEDESKTIDLDVEVLEQTKPLIAKTKASIQQTMKMGSSEEQFLATILISGEVKKFNEILLDAKQVSNRQMKFTEIDQLTQTDGQLKKSESLGQTVLLKDKEVIDTFRNEGTRTNAATKTDSTRKGVIGKMEILPNGKHLYLDIQNKKLKLFGANRVFISELALLGKAVSMVSLNDNEVLVTYHNQTAQSSFQKVNIDSKKDIMTLGGFIQTTLKHQLVMKYTDTTLLTIAVNESGNWFIQIIDHKGNVEGKSARLDDNAVKYSESLALSLDKKVAYLVDIRNGCVGVTINGETLFKYKEESKYNAYSGIVIDEAGDIYIGAFKCASTGIVECANILKLSEGKKVKSLFQEDKKCLMIPRTITRNKMWVYTVMEDGKPYIDYIYYKLV